MDPSTIEAFAQLYKIGGVGAVVVAGGAWLFSRFLNKTLEEQKLMREEQKLMREEFKAHTKQLENFNKTLLIYIMKDSGGEIERIAELLGNSELKKYPQP